jgi:SOS-response transcriptional repressor LexA
MSEDAAATRPSKKQRELLSYIDGFITGHGYGPSYREVMNALNYKSVSTVAVHIDNLIKKGHLRKRDKSARSLEVVRGAGAFKQNSGVTPEQQKWIVELVGKKFAVAETDAALTQRQIDNLYVLVGALQVLGLEDAARSFKPRLLELHKK